MFRYPVRLSVRDTDKVYIQVRAQGLEPIKYWRPRSNGGSDDDEWRGWDHQGPMASPLFIKGVGALCSR